MPIDSLEQDLDDQFERRFGSDGEGQQPRLPIRVLKRSRDAIHAARESLSQTETISLDYQGFIRFLASCPVPMVDANDVQKTAFLGSGWTMTVFKGDWRVAGKSRAVAVKQLNLELALGMSSQEEYTKDLRLKILSIVLEIRMMSHELLRNHQNIVRLLGVTWNEGSSQEAHHSVVPALIVELAACIDDKPLTLDIYVQMKPEGLTLETKTMLLADIASGLAALHALGVVHGDVKPENILIFERATRIVAKISDFGFCIAGDVDLETAKGGTPYWNAPECVPEASAELRQYRHENMRDYFSFGLLIWFVLFEELPFHGDAKAFNALKLQDNMKEQIDKAFHSQYRLRPVDRDTSPSTSVSNRFQQEQYHLPSQRWIPCSENRQHVLRFLMQWVLVRSPSARASSFDLYRRLFDDESSSKVAQRTFETPGAWDAEWNEFGLPVNRLRKDLQVERLLARQKTLYAINPDTELADWGKLRVFENQLTTRKIHKLQGKNIPLELQMEIFNQSLNIANQQNKSLEHLKIVAESYMAGFGVKKDEEQAIQWYRRAAEAGDPEASDILLRTLSPGCSVSQLGREMYCQLLTQVLLAPFRESGVDSKALSNLKHTKSLNELEKILCEHPDLTLIPLERAFKLHTLEHSNAQYGDAKTGVENRKSWGIAVKAIKDDDQETLVSAIQDDPSLARGLPNGIDTLAHVAVRFGRAGLLRMLIQDLHVNPIEANVNGLTPLSLAVKIGATWAVRVLVFSDKKAQIRGDDAAMDNASEGSGDLTRVLYDKFVSGLRTSDQTELEMDRFRRWSFFSLASAVVNNNWGVYCTLLAIGVDPNTTNPSPTISATTFFSTTLLAATTYNPIMLATALAFGASVDTRVPFPDSRTALHLACGKYQDVASSLGDDNFEAFQYWTFSRTRVSLDDFPAMQKLSIWTLLENGAELEAQDYHGYTPLSYALAECSDFCAATMILEHNPPANINAANFSGNTALHEAARDNDLSRLEFCLKFGASIEQQTEMGETALALATKEGNIEICKRLLFAGASISARDSNGQNCLCLAVQKSQFEVIRLFEVSALERSETALGRLILDEDCRGWNALHTCIMRSAIDDTFVGIFENWLDSIEDADLNAQDALGWSLLHMAISANQACAEILLERGASPDTKDSVMGWTPLHHACNEGNADMWNLLLAYGADFYAPDDIMGWTPLTVMEQAMDRLRIDENENFEDPERERLARKRVRMRDSLTAFFTRESLNRIVRPVTQADLEAQIEINRAAAFPEQLGVEAPFPEKSVRKLKTCFFVDSEGRCRRTEIVSPSRNVLELFL